MSHITKTINEKIGLFGFIPEIENGIPNWKFSASGGSTTTITVSTIAALQHNESIHEAAADFFNQAKIYFPLNTPTVALRGVKSSVSDFAWAADVATFTVPILPATPAATELFYVLFPLPASNVSFTPDVENIERADFKRKTLDPLPSIKGLKIGSGSFDFELLGLTQPLGDGDTPSLDFISRLLEAFGTRRALQGTLVFSNWGSTTSGEIDPTSGYAIGDFIVINNEARRITAIASTVTEDTITVAPPFTLAPEAGDEVFFVESWEALDENHRTHTFLSLTDDRLEEMIGCACNISGSGAFGELLTATIEFDAGDWNLYDDFDLDAILPTKTPPEFRTTSGAYFGATDLCINSFEFDAGFERQQIRDTCAGQQFQVRSRSSTVSVTFRDVSKIVKEVWEVEGTKDFLQVFVGTVPGDILGISGFAQLQDPSSAENVNETRYWQANFGIVESGLGSYAKPRILRA